MKKFETRNDLIESLPTNMIISEIGVFKGDFSKKLLEIMKPKELHLIDLFEGVVPSGDKDGNNLIYANLEDEYKFLIEQYKKNPSVIIHKGKSFNILEKFNNDYFDMIYIDGDHSYHGVMSDLLISYDKVKNKGFICGHDYSFEKFPGVVQAVDEFVDKYGLEIQSITKDGCPSFCIENKK